jgi:hypothetical protein
MHKTIKKMMWKTTTRKAVTVLLSLFVLFTGYKIYNPTACSGYTCKPVTLVEGLIDKTAKKVTSFFPEDTAPPEETTPPVKSYRQLFDETRSRAWGITKTYGIKVGGAVVLAYLYWNGYTPSVGDIMNKVGGSTPEVVSSATEMVSESL